MNWRRNLTAREIEVALLIAVECLTTKAAARHLGLSFRTIEVHRYRILAKLELPGNQQWNPTAQLVRMVALEDGVPLLSGPPAYDNSAVFWGS